jgi:hypothetical protein
MWGLFSIAFLVVIFALLLFKLIPPYLDDLKISNALTSLKRQAEGGSMSRRDILIALEKRFDIDSVTHVDLRRDVIIRKRGTMAVITIDYEAQVPLVYNISALMEFNHSVEVPSSE